MTQINYDYLKKNGYTDEQISYLKLCSNQKDWEDYDIQKQWILGIKEMTDILSKWDTNLKFKLVS